MSDKTKTNSMLPAEKVTIKGVFLQQLVNEIKKNMNAEQFQALCDEFEGCKISPIKDYYATWQTEIEARSGQLLFPNKPPQEQAVLVGQLSFKAFGDSVMGKTIMSLMGNDPKTLALNVTKSFTALMKGLKVEAKELNDQTVVIHFFNSPYNPDGLKGLFLGGFQYIQVNGEVSYTQIQAHEFEFTLKWAKSASRL